MARGWESKSVEAQIESSASPADRGSALSAAERRRLQLLRDRELSRQRVLAELAGATSPIRRASLESALAFLEEEIRSLS